MSAELFTLPIRSIKGTKTMLEDPATCFTRRDRAIVEIVSAFPDIAADAQPLDAGEPGLTVSAEAFVRLVELNTVIARTAMLFHIRPNKALSPDAIARTFGALAMELSDVLAAARSIEDRPSLH